MEIWSVLSDLVISKQGEHAGVLKKLMGKVVLGRKLFLGNKKKGRFLFKIAILQNHSFAPNLTSSCIKCLNKG
jgi:hypothetical protein